MQQVYAVVQSVLQIQKAYSSVEHIRVALHAQEPIDVVSEWKQMLHSRWKNGAFRERVSGMPPSFARRTDCPNDPAVFVAKVFGHSNWQGVRTWRRKLLHFPSDGRRPPFYGSFSRSRCSHVGCCHACFTLLSCFATLLAAPLGQRKTESRRRVVAGVPFVLAPIV